MGYLDDAAHAVDRAAQVVGEANLPLARMSNAALTMNSMLAEARNTVLSGATIAYSSGKNSAEWDQRNERIRILIDEASAHLAAATETANKIRAEVAAFANTLDTDAARISAGGTH